MKRFAILAAVALVALPESVAQMPAPAFDVASVKPNPSGGRKQGKGIFLPGQVTFTNGSLRQFVMAAFQVRSDMVEGGPGWMESDHFDIVAKAPADADEQTLRAMFQTLLAEHFKLVIHRKERVMPEDALVPGKVGRNYSSRPHPESETASGRTRTMACAAGYATT